MSAAGEAKARTVRRRAIARARRRIIRIRDDRAEGALSVSAVHNRWQEMSIGHSR